MMQRIYLTKKYPPHGKWRIPIFRHHCLILPIILSWLYLGINRNPYKCIPPDLRKNLAEAESLLHIAHFCMKNPAVNDGGQNKWSGGCPSRRRKQNGTTGRKHSQTQGWSVGRPVHQGAHAGGQNPVGLRLRHSLCRGQTGADPEKSRGGLLQPEKNRPDL